MAEGRPSLACLDTADFEHTDLALNGLHPSHFIVSGKFIDHEIAETSLPRVKNAPRLRL